MYASLSDDYLAFTDNEEWANVLLNRNDFPDGTFVQTHIDALDGMTTYVLTSIQSSEGEITTAESSEDFPYLAIAFDFENKTCVIRGNDQQLDATCEVVETDNPDYFALLVTASNGETHTLIGAYDGNTLTVDGFNSGTATLTMVN